MTIEELKALSPNAKPYQFEQHAKFNVGDRVYFMYCGERCSAIIQRFFNLEHGKPRCNMDNTSVRLVDDYGRLVHWLNICKFSKSKPETATGGEGDKQRQP